MKTKLLRNVLFAIGLLLTCMTALATENEQLGFAQHLFDQQEYYRAITEYERFLYLYPESDQAGLAKYQIAQCYFSGQQYEPALTRFEALRAEEAGSVLGLQAVFRTADSYYELGQYEHVILSLKQLNHYQDQPAAQEAGNVYAGVCYLRLADPNLASNSFSRVSKTSKNHAHTLFLQQAIDRYRDLPQKTPWLAGTLSAVLPGAGQLYNGRPGDAFISFALNGVLLWATIESFDNDQYVAGSLLGAIELGWYAGNIYNAVSGSHKFNNRYKQSFFEKLDMDFRLPFHDATSQPMLSVHYRTDF